MKRLRKDYIKSSFNEGIPTPILASSDTSKDASGATGPDSGQQGKSTLEVHMLSDETTCQQCGCLIGAEEMLVPVNMDAICLKCAGLDHLVFLKSGNATLTKRAVEQFGRRIVVLRIWKTKPAWRRGVLVDQKALDRAQAQCAEDAENRKISRAKQAVRRERKDAELMIKFAEKIGILFPGSPVDERVEIARRACERGSDRVGRSAAGQRLDDQAITSAVRAHLRHTHTNYDALMHAQFGRDLARNLVRDVVDAVYSRWLTDTTETVNKSQPS